MKKLDFIKVFLAAMVAAASAYTQENWTGNGTKQFPWVITSAEGLKELADSVNTGNDFSYGKYFKLGADIILNDTTDWKTPATHWMPIGKKTTTNTVSFAGALDGSGFVVSGLYINDSNDSYQGLFGYVSLEGVIKNLGIVGAYVKGGAGVGGLAGDNAGIIENCYVIGDVAGNNTVGGLVGVNIGTIENCYTSGNINSDNYWAGGLVGNNSSGMFFDLSSFETLNIYGKIKNCYTSASVVGSIFVGGLAGRSGVGSGDETIITNCYATGNVTGESYIGGLVGTNFDNISNSYATGNVTATGIADDDLLYFYVNSSGGLTGDNSGGTITNCYATGNVEGIDNVGGLVGHQENGNIENCYYDKETSNCDDIGKGDGKTSAQMKQQSTYNFWDFTDIWTINPTKNNGYPYLGVIGDVPTTTILKNTMKKIIQTANFAGIKNGQINLNLKAGAYTAQLYNLQGRLIKSVDIAAINGTNATGLRTDNLSKGILILNVKQAGVSVLKQKITVK
jgi:hypothetical protein